MRREHSRSPPRPTPGGLVSAARLACFRLLRLCRCHSGAPTRPHASERHRVPAKPFAELLARRRRGQAQAAASGQSTRWTGQAKQALVRLRIDRGAPACGVAAQNAGTQPLRVQSGGLRRPGRRHRTCPLHPRRAARAHCRTGTCAAVAARRRSRAAAWECEDGVRRRRLQAR